MTAQEKPVGQIYAEGAQARTHGLPRDLNPYPLATAEFAACEDGWKSAGPPANQARVEAPTG